MYDEFVVVFCEIDFDGPALIEDAEKDFVCEGLFYFFLDESFHGSCTEVVAKAAFGEPFSGFVCEGDGDLSFSELDFELSNHFVDDLFHDVGIEGSKGDDGIESVTEFGREDSVDGFGIFAGSCVPVESEYGFVEIGSPGVACHDDEDISEIDMFSVVVCEGAVVHDLEEDIEDV